jgi:tetratricopeptide (TPR) repeat protein
MDLTATVAFAHVERGEALLKAGDVDGARKAHHRAVELVTRALGHDQNVLAWRNTHDQAMLLEAAIDSQSNAHDEALHLARAALETLEPRARNGTNTDPFILLQRARLQAGIELAALGRGDEARQQWQAILDGVANSPDVSRPMLVYVLVAAHQKLGHDDVAKALADHLKDLSRASADQPPTASRL